MPGIQERLTTAECALALGCRQSQAIALLRGAGVFSTRLGPALLWDAVGVHSLAETLKTAPRPELGAVHSGFAPIVRRAGHAFS